MQYRSIIIATLSLLSAVPAVAQDGLFDILDAAHETVNEAIKDATDGEYELAYEPVSQEEFMGLLNGFQALLQDGDLDALAEWAPTGHDLVDTLENIPGAEPYADWLRQRLDYADVAREASVKFPPPTPAKPAPALPQKNQHVRKADTWTRKLSKRPPPARAADLVPQMKKIFTDTGIPSELVWVAEVESSFNPQARSPVGAAGLFQLMPATAKHLGLSLAPEDERLIPEKNARAAADYLKYLHGRFDDWPLALAAYNGGEGRVGKLLKKHGVGNFDGIADHLPTETRMYVPKVLATIRLREPGSGW